MIEYSYAVKPYVRSDGNRFVRVYLRKFLPNPYTSCKDQSFSGCKLRDTERRQVEGKKEKMRDGRDDS